MKKGFQTFTSYPLAIIYRHFEKASLERETVPTFTVGRERGTKTKRELN